MMKSRIPKPTSGHLDRSFFFRCPEVGLGVLTFRCPEVGLEFLTCRCPEVGLEFLTCKCPEVGLEFLSSRCPEVELGSCYGVLFLFSLRLRCR